MWVTITALSAAVRTLIVSWSRDRGGVDQDQVAVLDHLSQRIPQPNLSAGAGNDEFIPNVPSTAPDVGTTSKPGQSPVTMTSRIVSSARALTTSARPAYSASTSSAVMVLVRLPCGSLSCRLGRTGAEAVSAPRPIFLH